MKRKSLMVLVVIGAIMFSSVFVFADDLSVAGSNLSNKEIAELINDEFNILNQGDSNIDVEVPTAAAIIDNIESDKELTELNRDEILSRIDDQVVSIEKNEAETIHVKGSLLNGDATQFKIQLPLDSATAELADGVVIAEDNDSGFKVTTEVFEGGVRNCFVIEDSNSPESYPIEYDFNTNVVLAYGVDENEQRDGSIIICNESEEMLAIITPAWAKDSNGKDIETYYEISGNTVIQIVNHHSLDVAYPIVADPITLDSLFSKHGWIWNAKHGGYTLSLHPTNVCRAYVSSPSSGGKSNSWNIIANKYGHTSHWKNSGALKNQYYCHIALALSKADWNLDVWRPNVSYAETLARGCNP